MHHFAEDFKRWMIDLSVHQPKLIVRWMIGISSIVLLAALLPVLIPETRHFLPLLKVDTDPENMLPDSESARIFHNEMKQKMDLHDLVGVGIINSEHKAGVFNRETLAKIHSLAEFSKTLSWENAEGTREGTIASEIMAPSTIDHIAQRAPGTVTLDWLMPKVPETAEEIEALREKVNQLSYVQGILFSEDGQAVAMTLPITNKDASSRIYSELQEEIKRMEGNGDRFHIAGLPVAEDVFGIEMFKQMVIAAPAAMLLIFLLMLAFFKKTVLIVSPLLVALVSVIISMGLLVVTGHTIHIMSSMIPIFIMPIAVLDAVHILSDFFDVYQWKNNRKEALISVMDHLFTPMLFTSVTTAVGFASLVLTPIPPVRVFGSFVAIGVLMAWLWTILFIPAYIMLLPAKTLEGFGRKPSENRGLPVLDRFLSLCRNLSYRHAGKVIIGFGVLVLLSVWGITKIYINDNPTRWFQTDHPIRLADTEMNKHLAGTYDTYLSLRAPNPSWDKAQIQQNIRERFPKLDANLWKNEAQLTGMDWINALERRLEDLLFTEDLPIYDEVLQYLATIKQEAALFKSPEVLQYMEALQNALEELAVVGKTLSVVDLQKIVNRELHSGEAQHYVVPASQEAVAQHYVTFQGGHRPEDLWHFVTPDYSEATIWVLLKSGNNADMKQVKDAAHQFMELNPPPHQMSGQWFGLTYINLVWQNKMVTGMLKAFLSSFGIVLLIMIFLFRSVWWGLLSMLPLTLTILIIYGVIGFIGKEYDMPIAVLSSLSLGLAIDYAIHFLARSRSIRKEASDWGTASKVVFRKPAKAIMRNVVVIGLGFIPLLYSPLVPYQTVGLFIASILILAGMVSILLLPALIKVLENRLFHQTFRQKHTKMKIIVKLIPILLISFATSGYGQLTTDEIVQKANHVAYYSGKDGRAKVQMLIRDKLGRSRKRSFVILRKNSENERDGAQQYYVYFNRPTDMAGTAFLVWKHLDKEDDRWLYLPALDLVKRIAGGDKRTSFVGSTFLYEDVSGRGLTADRHRRLPDTNSEYVIENIPLDKTGVKFTRYIAYVDKESFIPIKIEYYNDRDELYRLYENKKWEWIQGHPTVLISSMKDLDTGTETFNRYSEIEYDLHIDEHIFTERFLRNAPRNYISY